LNQEPLGGEDSPKKLERELSCHLTPTEN